MISAAYEFKKKCFSIVPQFIAFKDRVLLGMGSNYNRVFLQSSTQKHYVFNQRTFKPDRTGNK